MLYIFSHQEPLTKGLCSIGFQRDKDFHHNCNAGYGYSHTETQCTTIRARASNNVTYRILKRHSYSNIPYAHYTHYGYHKKKKQYLHSVLYLNKTKFVGLQVPCFGFQSKGIKGIFICIQSSSNHLFTQKGQTVKYCCNVVKLHKRTTPLLKCVKDQFLASRLPAMVLENRKASTMSNPKKKHPCLWRRK